MQMPVRYKNVPLVKTPKNCPKKYKFSHHKLLGSEMPFIEITVSNWHGIKKYHCPCPPDPCASEAFYNQCRDHESKNMHGINVAEAEFMLHPKDFPMNYSETAKLVWLTEVSCFFPPRVATSLVAAYSSSGL